MKKSPAFSLYPDKALAGTDHLSGDAFKAYWKVLFWMWLHSEDQFSMKDSDAMWKVATGKKGKKLEKIREEIMQDGFCLFQIEAGRLISKGLRKEALKQRDRREKATAAINKRWEKKRKERNTDVSNSNYLPSPSPFPSNNVRDFSKNEKSLVQDSDSGKGKSRKKSVKVFDVDGEEVRLSILLHDLMKENNPKAKITKKQIYETWPKHVDLMIRMDNRTVEEIEQMIRWSQDDEFWKMNIHSMGTLREKFDKLWMKANQYMV